MYLTYTTFYICICDSVHIHTHTDKSALSIGLCTSVRRNVQYLLWCRKMSLEGKSIYRVVNKYEKSPVSRNGFAMTTVQEKRPWDHQASDVSFCRLPFPLLLAPWFHTGCCMASSSHPTA